MRAWELGLSITGVSILEKIPELLFFFFFPVSSGLKKIDIYTYTDSFINKLKHPEVLDVK